MVGALLVRQILALTGQGRVATLQARNQKTQRRHEEMRDAHDKLQAKLRQGEDERRMIQAQIVELKRKTRLAAEDNFEFVHEVGEPAPDKRLYMGMLALGSQITVGSQLVSDTPLRSARNVLVIWADTPQSALRAARQAFPEDAGFAVSNVALPSAPRPTAAAAQ
jgi:hypothetical protein